MKKLIILFTALTMFVGCQSLNKSTAITTITADELRKEYKTSKDGVYSKYNGIEMIISGKVHSKEDGVQPALKFGNQFGTGELTGVPAVYCETSEKSPKAFDEFKADSEVKVRGHFFVNDEVASLVLKGCQIDGKTETKESAPITETSEATQLAEDYAKSKSGFIEKYYGKELNITGQIGAIIVRDSPEQVSYVDIDSGNISKSDRPFFNCSVDSQHKKILESLKTGDKVMMKGRLFITKRLHPGSDTLELLGCEVAGAK
jgi:hypothetical protein